MIGVARWCFWWQLTWFCLHHWIARYVAAWAVALTVGWIVTTNSWHYFDHAPRNDKNSGHVTIDFGGQWTMGRMLVAGYGPELYSRDYQRLVLSEAYTIADQEPEREASARSDAENMLYWFMGRDHDDRRQAFASCAGTLMAGDPFAALAIAAHGHDQVWTEKTLARAGKRNVGGPLYPPINAFWMAPLGALTPNDGYHLRQLLDLPLVLLIALGISLLSHHRIWMPIAVIVVMLYPGFFGNQLLGQNSTLSLLFLVWGWVFLVWNRPGWAGVVFGLLAFKPVWAATYFLIFLLARRWWLCAAMGLTGLLQIALTLPVVGVQAWLDWLEVGREATYWYNVDNNWTHMSRDLYSLCRRWILDWEANMDTRNSCLLANIVSWAVLLSAFEIAVRLLWLRRDAQRAVVGPVAAFTLLSGWLCCWHFMYYDVLLTFLPLMLLLTEWPRWQRAWLLSETAPQWEAWQFEPWARLAQSRRPGVRYTTGLAAMLWLPLRTSYGLLGSSVALLLLLFLIGIEYPFRSFGWSDRDPMNTIVLIVTWLWCAWLWTYQLRQARLQAVVERIEDEVWQELPSAPADAIIERTRGYGISERAVLRSESVAEPQLPS